MFMCVFSVASNVFEAMKSVANVQSGKAASIFKRPSPSNRKSNACSSSTGYIVAKKSSTARMILKRPAIKQTTSWNKIRYVRSGTPQQKAEETAPHGNERYMTFFVATKKRWSLSCKRMGGYWIGEDGPVLCVLWVSLVQCSVRANAIAISGVATPLQAYDSNDNPAISAIARVA